MAALKRYATQIQNFFRSMLGCPPANELLGRDAVEPAGSEVEGAAGGMAALRKNYLWRRRILTSKLTTPFWSRMPTIETVRVMLYST